MEFRCCFRLPPWRNCHAPHISECPLGDVKNPLNMLGNTIWSCYPSRAALRIRRVGWPNTKKGTRYRAFGNIVSRTLLIGRLNRFGLSFLGLSYSSCRHILGIRPASWQLRLVGRCLLKRHNCEFKPRALTASINWISCGLLLALASLTVICRRHPFAQSAWKSLTRIICIRRRSETENFGLASREILCGLLFARLPFQLWLMTSN